MERSLPLGRVAGFRGRDGKLTVRVASGEAARWTRLKRVLVAPSGGDAAEAEPFDVEESGAYRDRLVLKLRGVEDPSGAEALKGRLVLAPAEEVPALPEGVYYVTRLLQLGVEDESGRHLGRVKDVAGTGGVDLLVVEMPDGKELMVPMAADIVLEINEPEGRVLVRLPDGLLETAQ